MIAESGISLRRRTAAILLAACAGALVPPSPAAALDDYRKVTFTPTYRCPGTGVTMRWTGGRPGPLEVIVDWKPFATVDGNEVFIPADIIDATRRTDTTVHLRRPGVKGPLPLGDDIVTMRWRKPRWIKPVRQFGYIVPDTEGDLRVSLDAAEWDAGVVIERVILKKYASSPAACVAAAFRHDADWEVEKEGEILATLTAADGYEADLSRTVPARGDWIFRIRPAEGVPRCEPPPPQSGKGCGCSRQIRVTFHARCAAE